MLKWYVKYESSFSVVWISGCLLTILVGNIM
jgi:hypothetical protein